VERRKEPRLKARQPVTLTVLGVLGSHLIEACVLDMSGSGLQLRVPAPVACGTAVKIDARHTLMLGEVCRCEPAEGAYTVGVQLSHTLSSLMELELLNRALIGEGQGQGRKVESASESPVSRR
jgi:hypothetical protein